MLRKNPDKGFVLTSIVGFIFIILFLIVVFAVSVKLVVVDRFTPKSDSSLVWRSDKYPEKCAKYVGDTKTVTKCDKTVILFDAGDNLMTLVRGWDYVDLYALSKETGKQLWQSSLVPEAHTYFSYLINYRNRIYFFTDRISVFDEDTGGLVIEKAIPFREATNSVLAGEKFLIADKDKNKLYEINPENLIFTPIADLPYKISSDLQADDNIVYYKSHPRTIAFDYVNNRVVWESDFYSPDSIDDKYVYIMFGTRMIALDKKTGDVIWEVKLPNKNNKFALQEDSLVVVGEEEIYKIDNNSGNVINSYPNNSDGELKHIKVNDSNLYALDVFNDEFDLLSQIKSSIIVQDIDTGVQLARYRYGRSGIDYISNVEHPIIGEKYVYAVCGKAVCAFKKP